MKLSERVIHRLKARIENIWVHIPIQSGPVSEVKGKGRIVAESEKFLSGARGAIARFALNHPEAVIKKLNPNDSLALQNPSGLEQAFHQNWAKKLKPGDYDDPSEPKAEGQLGVIEFQENDSRIKYIEETYGLQPGGIGPKILTDETGKPVSVWDYIRQDGQVVGAKIMPAQEGWRQVRVPDIAGAIAAKGTQDLIAGLGLVDGTQPEAIFGRQAVLRTAVVNYAEDNKIGLSTEFAEFVVSAFILLAEYPELSGRDIIPAVLKQKK